MRPDLAKLAHFTFQSSQESNNKFRNDDFNLSQLNNDEGKQTHRSRWSSSVEMPQNIGRVYFVPGTAQQQQQVDQSSHQGGGQILPINLQAEEPTLK